MDFRQFIMHSRLRGKVYAEMCEVFRMLAILCLGFAVDVECSECSIAASDGFVCYQTL